MRSLSSYLLGFCSLIAMTAACASGGGPGLHAPARVEAVSEVASRPSHLIGAAELRTMDDRSLLDAIRRLRPTMLRSDKPTPSAEGVVAVYLDGVYLGGPEVLEGLSPIGIREVRRMSETEAFAYGTRRHPAGVIALRTRS